MREVGEGAQPWALQLAPGFIEAPLDDQHERLAFVTGSFGSREFPITATTASLRSQRRVGLLPGNGIPSDAIAASRKLNRLYIGGDAGLWEFPLMGDGEPTFVIGAPDLPPLTLEEARRAFGPDVDWQPTKRHRPNYHWMVAIDEGARRLFALCGGQQGSLAHVVEIDLSRRAITGMFPIPGFASGIRLSLGHQLVALPALASGPHVLDLSGKRVAALSDIEDLSSGNPYWNVAVRPSDGALLLARHRHQPGLVLWDWKHARLEPAGSMGAAPTYGPDDTLFFMRGSTEVWWVRESGPQLLAGVTVDGLSGSENWVTRPRVSADGRYLLAQLTLTSPQRTSHAGLVIDLVERRAQQVPGFHAYGIAWF